MKTQNYPALGSKVDFVRQDETGAVVQGTGTIHAICLDPSKRPMAHILDDTKRMIDGAEREVKFNVHLSCLNPTQDFVEEFKATMITIQNLGNEGNGKAQQIVAEYNERVEQAQAPVLGESIVFEGEEESTDEAPEEAPQTEAAPEGEEQNKSSYKEGSLYA